MRASRSPRDTLVYLDRKISRALEVGRGLTLSPGQLDALPSICLVTSIAEPQSPRVYETVTDTRALKSVDGPITVYSTSRSKIA